MNDLATFYLVCLAGLALVACPLLALLGWMPNARKPLLSILIGITATLALAAIVTLAL